jgi:(E)-4-hydroxy-3-methylbut-2-enyl-diphosphate synthase
LTFASRRPTRVVRAGTSVLIGGGNPIVVQGMTKAPAHDGPAVLAQVEAMAARGCELCRLAVPDEESLSAFAWVAGRSPLPLVADIHFDHRLALGAITAGAAKLRINPGNLGGPDALRQVALEATAAGVPIRVGVNLGSLEAELASSMGYTGAAMAESAMRQVRMLEDLGFEGIVISAKASDVSRTVEAYREIAARTDWPLHLGVTEAGPGLAGAVKGSLGIGLLLAEGIGDTIRVSLTGDPTDEIAVAYDILGGLELRRRGPELISCPTCGRCSFDVAAVARGVQGHLAGLTEPLVVAVMGCAVNGPGEARRADVGLAGAAGGRAVLFSGGRILRTVSAEKAVDELLAEIESLRQTSRASEVRDR